MWAVIGVWNIDSELIDTVNERVPLMAAGKITVPGFLHGTWTLQGHAIQVYADEASARRYHQDMIDQGAVDQPGIRNIVWDVAEVGAESGASGWTGRDGRRRTPE